MANGEITRLAMLVDADNASATVVKELLEEVAKYGTATVKRAYGDWTTPNLAGWKDHLHRHAIQPIQQFAYTKGKNSTDSAFIIDAMDLLYAGNVDGLCIVSSNALAAPACPRCAGQMVRRTAKKGPNAGESFWGCSAFPKCRGTA